MHAEQYGSSGWSFTAKVVATYDGIEKSFFLKVSILLIILIAIYACDPVR